MERRDGADGRRSEVAKMWEHSPLEGKCGGALGEGGAMLVLQDDLLFELRRVGIDWLEGALIARVLREEVLERLL